MIQRFRAAALRRAALRGACDRVGHLADSPVSVKDAIRAACALNQDAVVDVLVPMLDVGDRIHVLRAGCAMANVSCVYAVVRAGEVPQHHLDAALRIACAGGVRRLAKQSRDLMSVQVVEVLLKAGASPNAVLLDVNNAQSHDGADAEGQDDDEVSFVPAASPLAIAILTNRRRMARVLLQYGACVRDVRVVRAITQLETSGNLFFRDLVAECEPVDLRARKIVAALRAVRMGRIVLTTCDRGPWFGQLTRWLDFDFLVVFAHDLLSEKEVFAVLHMVQHHLFATSLLDFVERVFGWRFCPAIVHAVAQRI